MSVFRWVHPQFHRNSKFLSCKSKSFSSKAAQVCLWGIEEGCHGYISIQWQGTKSSWFHADGWGRENFGRYPFIHLCVVLTVFHHFNGDFSDGTVNNYINVGDLNAVICFNIWRVSTSLLPIMECQILCSVSAAVAIIKHVHAASVRVVMKAQQVCRAL